MSHGQFESQVSNVLHWFACLTYASALSWLWSRHEALGGLSAVNLAKVERSHDCRCPQMWPVAVCVSNSMRKLYVMEPSWTYYVPYVLTCMIYNFPHFASCSNIRIYEVLVFSKIISLKIFSNRIWVTCCKCTQVALYIPWKLLSGVEWTLLQSMEGRRKPGISCIQILCSCFLGHLESFARSTFLKSFSEDDCDLTKG